MKEMAFVVRDGQTEREATEARKEQVFLGKKSQCKTAEQNPQRDGVGGKMT